ncbi:hypothetical protein V500_01380 [Pseudogymnoascus sp. VKM F-4518 (FW-2643)]|nr:hypothetical protein V500_01380 [Pseudogymnoascus sp. VKM F-4518 (FW-2643)]
MCGGSWALVLEDGNSVQVFYNTSVLVTGDTIASILPAADKVRLPKHTTIIPAQGKIISPGFVDTHRHLWQTAFKTLGSNTSLAEYFNCYSEYSLAKTVYAPEDVYLGQLTGIYESLNAGVTTILDHSRHTWSNETALAGLEATVDSGARVWWCYGFHNLTNANWVASYDREAQVNDFLSLSQNGPWINSSVVSIGISYDGWTVESPSQVNQIIGLAQCYGLNTGRGCGLAIAHSVPSQTSVSSCKIHCPFLVMDPGYDEKNAVAEDAGKLVSLSVDVEVADMTDVQDSMTIDPVAEARIVWKLDIHILPILALMYMFNTLDRSNMGNAETDGLSTDLGLVGDQYNVLLSVFYVPYVVSAPFVGLVGKKYGPSRVLPIMMFVFGSMTLFTAAVQNFGGLFAIRWFLGGGTVIMSIIAYLFLPASGATAKFLSEEERKLAHYRLQVDSSSIVDQEFNIREALEIFNHPTTWVILSIEMCLGVPLQGVILYLPIIVKRLGYNTVKTNLYTVAPNITGAAMLLLLGFLSDFTHLRFPFVALGFLLTLTGFIIYACVNVTSQLQVAYYACFMMTWGTSAPSVLLDTWYNNNIANENKRVMLTSVAVPVANVMGLVASNIFQAKDAPKYFPALITTAIFGAVGFIITILLGLWMIYDNKRRDRAEGKKVKAKDISTELLAEGPANPRYRWYL